MYAMGRFHPAVSLTTTWAEWEEFQSPCRLFDSVHRRTNRKSRGDLPGIVWSYDRRRTEFWTSRLRHIEHCVSYASACDGYKNWWNSNIGTPLIIYFVGPFSATTQNFDFTKTWQAEVVVASNETRFMLKFLPVGLLVFFGILGCKNVQPSDLAGTWAIKDGSRKSLPAELQNASAKIVLDTNGTFVASDMPGLFYFPGRHAARLESGSGTWKIVSRDGKQQVQLNFQVIATGKTRFPTAHNSTFPAEACFIFWAMRTKDEESHLKRSN